MDLKWERFQPENRGIQFNEKEIPPCLQGGVDLELKRIQTTDAWF
jgi:hypothetical protein